MVKLKINNKNIGKLEYFLMFLFVVCCGFTAAAILPAKSYIIVAVGLYYVFSKRRHISRFSWELIATVFVMLIVAIVHYKEYGFIDTKLLNYIPLVIAGYFLVIVLGQRFPQAYLDVMFFLASISLVCYGLMTLLGFIPQIDALRGERTIYKGIFFWNVRENEIILGRNCGPFWEPGAFAGYLLMVFVLWFDRWKELWYKQRKKIIVLLLAFITTFSSQGYLIAFVLVVLFYLFKSKRRNFIVTCIVCSILLFLFLFFYKNLPFLEKKVGEQLELVEQWDGRQSLNSANRFTTTILDIKNIEKNPFWGNTSDQYILYQDYDTILWTLNNNGGYGSGSGVTNYIASNGLFLFALWIFLCFRSLSHYYASSTKALSILIILLLLGQAEMYNTYIFYQTIPFLFYCTRIKSLGSLRA